MTIKLSANPPICFPENLFSENYETSPEKRWWVVRTKSRQEKALAWSLKGLGIDYFLPLVPKPQKCKGRMRTSIAPLFNGYLFFKGTEEQRINALKTSRVAQIIEVEAQKQIEKELTSLAIATEEQSDLQLCDFVKRGQRVKIVSGPFMGMNGIVKTKKNKKRVILNIDAIRQAVVVEIDIDQARPI